MTVVLSVCIAGMVAANDKVPQRHHPSVSVVYDELSALSSAERHAIYRSLPQSTRDDLWTLHIEQYAERHSDLTDEQRDVLNEAIAFLQSGASDTPPNSAEWEIAVHRPLKMLEEHAKAVFGSEEAAARRMRDVVALSM